MTEHGGNLVAAAKRYVIPVHDWLDLSTGISPFAYPVGAISAAAWQRLPSESEAFIQAAGDYYGSSNFLAVAGSQAAIQVLPRLIAARNVVMVQPSYGEHAYCWQESGAGVRFVSEDAIEGAGQDCEVVVVSNPNNPTGRHRPVAALRGLHERLAAQDRWLVVDEAFVDTRPKDSLVRFAGEPGLVVLRSLGKFFGLAGLRVGFLFGPTDLLNRAQSILGPWTIPGPSIEAAASALRDKAFHHHAKGQLSAASSRLQDVLNRRGYAVTGATDFFIWTLNPEARVIQDKLARKGILVRAFDRPASLRFGLPGVEAQWQRLEAALESI